MTDAEIHALLADEILGRRDLRLEPFTSDWGASGRILDHYAGRGFRVVATRLPQREHWVAMIWVPLSPEEKDPRPGAAVSDASGPRAICLAALKFEGLDAPP